MTVCIDSNVLLGMFTASHAHRPILDAWLQKLFMWAVSTETLLEYEEIMQMAATAHGNLHLVSPTYRFHLITDDPDDDKFTDCAITSDADWLITSDGHFGRLVGSGYKPQPITPKDFINRFLKPRGTP